MNDDDRTTRAFETPGATTDAEPPMDVEPQTDATLPADGSAIAPTARISPLSLSSGRRRVRAAPRLLYPPRPWLTAGWLAMLVCAAAMLAAQELHLPVVSAIAASVTCGFISFAAFAPWEWIRQLNDDRDTIRDLSRRLRAIDLEDRRKPLSSVLLARDDEFGDLSRAIHNCLAHAIGSRAEARMLHRTMRDTIERRTRQATAKLERESISDALTGVGNRRALEQCADRIDDDKDSRRIGACDQVIAMMIDLDHFKQVNDTLGHDAGDDCIVFLAELLRATVRRDDLIVRLGGDEFVVVLRGTDMQGAEALAERLRSLFVQMPWPTDDAVQPTLSIGIAECPLSHAAPLDESIRLADRALYAAKECGRNRIAVHRAASAAAA